MKLRRYTVKRARIEIIPMIDVIFFLLVFFIISSLAMTKLNALPVSLPKTSAGAEAVKPNVVLTVRRDGKIFLNQAPTDLATLGRQLAYEMRERAQDTVVVSADEGAGYGLVIQVMDRARAVGVRKFALATQGK